MLAVTDLQVVVVGTRYILCKLYPTSKLLSGGRLLEFHEPHFLLPEEAGFQLFSFTHSFTAKLPPLHALYLQYNATSLLPTVGWMWVFYQLSLYTLYFDSRLLRDVCIYFKIFLRGLSFLRKMLSSHFVLHRMSIS